MSLGIGRHGFYLSSRRQDNDIQQKHVLEESHNCFYYKPFNTCLKSGIFFVCVSPVYLLMIQVIVDKLTEALGNLGTWRWMFEENT